MTRLLRSPKLPDLILEVAEAACSVFCKLRGCPIRFLRFPKSPDSICELPFLNPHIPRSNALPKHPIRFLRSLELLDWISSSPKPPDLIFGSRRSRLLRYLQAPRLPDSILIFPRPLDSICELPPLSPHIPRTNALPKNQTRFLRSLELPDSIFEVSETA